MKKPKKTPEENQKGNKTANGSSGIHCAFDKMVAVGSLVPNPKNPNKHSGDQITLLAEIIKHRGFRNSIQVSNRSGFIVAGHCRLEAARALDLDEVPVDFQDFESDADEWAHMIADNRIAELADIDERELEKLLTEVAGEIDIRLTGFDELPEIEPPRQSAEVPFSEAILESNNYVVLLFDNDIDWIFAQNHFDLEQTVSYRENGKPWAKGTGRVINGAEYLRRITSQEGET